MIVNLEMIRVNSLKAWMLAARPKTLAAAAVPVMVGTAWSCRIAGVGEINYIAMFLCFLFSFVMQIEANFVNDYYDCVRGNDNESRLGPQRACQQGWVTLKAMRFAMFITGVVASLVGLPLIFFGGWWLIIIGLLCMLFCFLYTTVLAGKGLGDILVIVFFGLIPCVCTSYVVMPSTVYEWWNMPWLPSLAVGLVIDTLLIINNYRDIDNDRMVGKITLVVVLGKRWSEKLYLYCLPVGVCLMLFELQWSALAQAVFIVSFIMHVHTWNVMREVGSGKELNRVLGMTARNIFVFGIVSVVAILFA